MKNIFFTAFILLFLFSFSFGDEYRSFTGSNGKEISAKLLSLDKEKDIVHIELKNGKSLKVRLNLFSDSDQEFIKNHFDTDNPFGDDEAAAETDNTGVPKLSSGKREKEIAEAFIIFLNDQHVSGKQFDKKMAEKAFEFYISNLDPMKVYFLKSDIDGFRSSVRTLPEKLKRGDMSLGFNVYNRYVQRIDEVVNIIFELLEKPFDFKVDEEYILDKDSITFANNSDELKDRWRKKLKYEILQIKTSQEKSDKSDPSERLKRRYESFRKRMFQEKNDDVLESFLSAVGTSFDLHSNYMSHRTVENFKIIMEKKLEGIGATLTHEDGYTLVSRLVPGGPAQKSGKLKVGDKIVGVGQGEDGAIEDIIYMRMQDAVSKIRGKGGSVVKLEILKTDGSKQIAIITRDVIDLEDSKVKSTIFESGKNKSGKPCKIGFIKTSDFYPGVAVEIKNLLQNFKTNDVDVVVLDLSFSGGGSFGVILNTIGLFIETGPMIQTKARNQKVAQVQNDTDPSIEWDGPLVILSSKLCAVDMLRESMKDYHRALIVGDSRSFGKPTMQQMKPLSESSPFGSIKFSFQAMYSPSGRSYCRGAESDIVLPSTTEVQAQIQSELKHWSEVKDIPPARQYPDFHLVTDDIVETLNKKSLDRIKKNKDFIALQKEIDIIKKSKNRKTISLNEKKYREEMKSQRDTDFQRIISERQQAGSKIVKDFYIDEVLSIAVDYVNLLP